MKNKFISKNTEDHNNYIGPEGSLSINSDDRTMHVHDGQTPNGIYEIGQDFKNLSKNKVYALNNGKIKEVIILPVSIDISAGGQHGYALVNGEVYSVGQNNYGQLGLGDTTRRTTWTPTGLTNVTAIAAGSYHGYALVDGEVYSVGLNNTGQLGLGDSGTGTQRTIWTPTGLTNVTAIAAGDTHGYALVDGEVYSVGRNSSGQLGLGDSGSGTDRNIWTPTGLTNVTVIAAGYLHGYALVDGEVYSVGYNYYGQLGLGDTSSRKTWTPTGLTNVTAIAAGGANVYGDHGYALVNGEVYSVGQNNYGQLGLGDTTRRTTWTPTGLTNVTAIAARSLYGYALVDGEVYSVGQNDYGQLGLGDTTRRTTWTPTGLTNVTAIAAGGITLIGHGYALVDGEVYSVGQNNYGQLGLGDTTQRTIWTPTGFPQ